jgi:hypothetical protein
LNPFLTGPAKNLFISKKKCNKTKKEQKYPPLKDTTQQRETKMKNIDVQRCASGGREGYLFT